MLILEDILRWKITGLISTKLCKGLYADYFFWSVKMLTYPPVLKPVSPAFFCASLDEFHPSFIPHSVTPFGRLYTSPYWKLSFWKSAIVFRLPNWMFLLSDTSPPFPSVCSISPQQCSIPRRCSFLPREGVVWIHLPRSVAHVHCAAVLSSLLRHLIPHALHFMSDLIRNAWLQLTPVIST